MEQDHSWEYDAPSHVVDFKDLDRTDTSDHWFEQRASGSEAQLATPLNRGQQFGGASKGNLPKAIVCPYVDAEVDPVPSTDAAPPSNIITSWGPRQPPNRNAARGPAAQTNPSAQPRRVSKRKEASAPAETTSAPAETTSAPVESTSAVVVPPVKKQKRSSAGRPAPRLSGNLRRSCRPQTAATSSPLPNSTEALELERIKTLQSEVAAHRRQNEASYKAALAGDHLPKRLVLSTTIPKEFHFSTDARVRPGSSTASDQGNFQAQLRKHPSSPSKGPKGPTMPRPFNLSAGSKRRAEDATTQPYVPIAEQIAAFQRRTPDRYHLRSRQMQGRGPSQVKGEHLKITQPHTPQLMTGQRSRPTLTKSHAELEDEEVEKMQKFQFKALELNRKILEGALNPKKPAAKEPTRTQSFELQVDQRLQQRQAARKPEEEERPVVFHPRPRPTRLLAEVVGVPDKKVAHPTVPESPAFALKKRVRLEPKAEEVKPPSPIRAHPVPHFGLPFQPRLPEKSQVESCPFSFDVREQESRVLKEKKLEMLRNEEVPKFKAQPLPDFHEVNLPERKVVLSTKPEPFRLRVDERGGVKTDRWDKMVKEEQKRQVEATTFRARPNTVIHKEPFQPKKENRCAAVPEAFQLSTERRAVERQEFERAAMEKEALRARMEEQQRRLAEEREVEEVARMRHEQVHKAQPVRKYKPVEVRKCDTALTVPQSPKFSDRFHL